ncbi:MULTISPECIES: glycosyl hydrolase family 17 protein [Dyella]|uniref:Endo-1,3-beta-glucanase btgC n=2 Tax=Dyella TaxID=231454 RepID=A0A4R0YIJ7_9GAMM|nr:MULTISPECIES: glycosyl hydrolase family 17 protein [Dyella]TBR36250.1 glycoside hydrolase family 17 [Dyella terrae]TCI05907.1 glycoside hydrolase family 17 [Dyella soli]
MSSTPTLSSRARWCAWLVLVLAAVAGAWWWWAIGRPVDLPDAPSARVACVSYAPFREPGETPLDPRAFVSPDRIDADLKALSQRFDCVRTYSQGQGLAAVPEIAGRYGMKVIMGIWLGRDPIANAREVQLGIASARAHPDVLRGVIVGNEVLLRGELSSEQLATFVREVRAAIPAQVPVSYADVWEFWLRYPEMAKAADYLTIHILPYWEDEPVPPEHAVRHVAEVYAKMKAAFPDKQVMIGETGWPSAGRPRRAASASVVNEARYLREFLQYAGSVSMPYNVIEAFDQPWKRAQEGTVGGYWGIFDVNAKPKFAMQGPVIEEPRWWLGWVAGWIGAVLFAAAGLWRRDWKGLKGWSAIKIAGFATGTALAWQYRQMFYACRNPLEWGLSAAACIVGLLTALSLARWLANRLADGPYRPAPLGWWRFGWLFVLALEGLLLAFDGRYRDFPMGLFALPCVGYGLVAWLDRFPETPGLALEERFLACWLPALAAVVVIQEIGLNPVTWLWLGLNLAIALPVLIGWRRSRLEADEA